MVLKAIRAKELSGMDYCIYKFILESFYRQNKTNEYRIYIYRNIYDEDAIFFKVTYQHFIIRFISSKECLKMAIIDTAKNETYNRISLSYIDDFSFATLKKLIDLEIQTIL